MPLGRSLVKYSGQYLRAVKTVMTATCGYDSRFYFFLQFRIGHRICDFLDGVVVREVGPQFSLRSCGSVNWIGVLSTPLRVLLFVGQCARHGRTGYHRLSDAASPIQVIRRASPVTTPVPVLCTLYNGNGPGRGTLPLVSGDSKRAGTGCTLASLRKPVTVPHRSPNFFWCESNSVTADQAVIVR